MTENQCFKIEDLMHKHLRKLSREEKSIVKKYLNKISKLEKELQTINSYGGPYSPLFSVRHRHEQIPGEQAAYASMVISLLSSKKNVKAEPAKCDKRGCKNRAKFRLLCSQETESCAVHIAELLEIWLKKLKHESIEVEWIRG